MNFEKEKRNGPAHKRATKRKRKEHGNKLEGCGGKLKLVIEDAVKDEDTGEVKWPAKNAVKTYLAGKKGQEKMAERRVKTAPKAAVKTDDEEIPF